VAGDFAMNRIKGERLYVNLSASQTRRRLAGHGFGVRKIRSNGRNQAEIIHTATGQHLRELRQLFSDVLPPAPMGHDARGREGDSCETGGRQSPGTSCSLGAENEVDASE
jgi:hypothetical protein